MNVIVIGAGVVGCAVAHELASRGARVRVFEARAAGQGATRASAGILAPTIEGHVPALLDLGVRSLALYEEFIGRVSHDSGLEVEYERNGTLQVALDGQEADALRSLARTFEASGIAHRLMQPADARAFEAALPPDTTIGLFVPQHGYVAVGQLTQALAQAAARRGATLTNARVVGVDADGVRTDRDHYDADAIIVTTGSWTDALTNVPVVKPIRGQLLELRLDRRPAARPIWGKRVYAVPWRDGTVLLGATVEDAGFDERATASAVHELITEGMRVLPVLRDATFEGVRVGLRPMTRDELPAVGASSTIRRVFYATGHYRNGVLLAPLTAKLVADLVLDGREGAELAALRPQRLGL